MAPVFVKKADCARVMGLHRKAIDRLVEAGAIREAPRLPRYVYREDVEAVFEVHWPDTSLYRPPEAANNETP